jgi:Beta-galactosidase
MYTTVAVGGLLVTGIGGLSGTEIANMSGLRDINGIYLIVPIDRPIISGPSIISRAITMPFVDGGYIRTSWRSIEPERGKFQWRYLDEQIAAISALNKKIAIGIDAGQRSPDWLYTEGAAGFKTVVEIPRQQDFCEPMMLPVPWDTIFLKEWDRLVGAVGARYAAAPSLVMVKITGIAYRTDETLLPRETGRWANGQGIAQGKRCHYPNDIEQWGAVGYTAEKVSLAFAQIATSFARSFPRQALVLMTGHNAFPPLGEDGSPDETARELPQTRFFAYGRSAFGQRFVGQVNSLRADQVDNRLVEFGQTNPIGFQAAWPVTGDETCIMSGGKAPCDQQTTFRRALERARGAGASFVELFKEDLVNPEFAAILKEFHGPFGL